MPTRTTPRAKQPAGGKHDRYVKALFFGPEGGGKTHLLGTATLDKRTCPIAIIDFEGGVLDVLTGLPGGPNGPKWYHIPCETWHDLNAAYERLRVNKEGFKAVGIDSLSETHIFALMTILDELGAGRSEPDLVQQDDYGKAMVQIRRFARMFRDLPLHVFYTGHDKQEIVPRDGNVTMVKLSGQLAKEIPGMMTLSGYYGLSENEDGEVERVLLLQNYAKIRTKVRMPWGTVAPDELVNPTITDVLDALHV